MNRPWVIATAVLAVLLVLTNVFWLMRVFDLTVMFATRDRQSLEYCHALEQALELLPPLAAGRTRDELLATAKSSAPADEAFEKDGAHWFGSLGFELDDQGQLRRVLPVWEPFECD